MRLPGILQICGSEFVSVQLIVMALLQMTVQLSVVLWWFSIRVGVILRTNDPILYTVNDSSDKHNPLTEPIAVQMNQPCVQTVLDHVYIIILLGMHQSFQPRERELNNRYVRANTNT